MFILWLKTKLSNETWNSSSTLWILCAEQWIKEGADTCFSSCNRPGACQTGRKSSLVCFPLRSSAGRPAWASPCMYLWYWSPGNGQKGKRSKKRQRAQSLKQMCGDRLTHRGMRMKKNGVENNKTFFFLQKEKDKVSERFDKCLLLHHSFFTYSVWRGGGITNPSLSCYLSQGSVKTLPASSEQIAVGL